MYNCPKSTIWDAHQREVRGTNPADAHGKMGRGILSDADEAGLVKHIRRMAERHFPMTILDIREAAYKLATVNLPTHSKAVSAFEGWHAKQEASEGWWRLFKQRHPEVSVCEANAMEVARSTVTQEQLDSFLTVIKALYDTYPHLVESRYWFDTDETPLQAGGRESKVVTVKGTAPNQITSPNDKLRITILPCICANGTQTPPLLIVPGELLTTPAWWPTLVPHLRGTALESATCVSQARLSKRGRALCDCNFLLMRSFLHLSIAGERLHV